MHPVNEFGQSVNQHSYPHIWIYAKVLSYFNVNTKRGENRVWEVGNHSRYDDLDTKQSGIRLLI